MYVKSLVIYILECIFKSKRYIKGFGKSKG